MKRLGGWLKGILSHNGVGPFGFAVRELNPWVVLSFVFVLVLWIGQELWLRDRFPVDQYRRFHRVMDILAVAWGSFITGYIFHLIVDHFPSKKKDYELQRAVENELGLLLQDHQSMLMVMLELVPRDKAFEDYSIYEQSSNTSLFIERLIEHWFDVDIEYYNEINDRIRLLKEDKALYSVDLRKAIDEANKYVRDRVDDMDLPMGEVCRRYEDMTIAVSYIHRYVEKEVEAGRIIEPYIVNHLMASITYKALWDSVDLVTAAEL